VALDIDVSNVQLRNILYTSLSFMGMNEWMYPTSTPYHLNESWQPISIKFDAIRMDSWSPENDA